MSRPRSSALALLVAIIAPLLVVACSQSGEQQLLVKYFQASRMRDNTTLTNIATVSFSPDEDGVFTGLKVVRENPEQRRTLRLKELAAEEEAARLADEEFNKKKKEYQDANLEAIDRVLKAEREGGKLRGDDLKVQAEWTKWRDDTQHVSKRLTEARQALSAERSMAEISVFDSRNPVDVSKFDGELIEKDLIVGGKLKKGEAPAADAQLHVKVARADLKNGPDGQTVAGRWIVTHVSPAEDGKTPGQ
ncbi:MAG: hypothetical protein H6Q08_706 [Acidobacteria bacterium]|nr:hypothetical protein [Acidobacteriota bacterium]